MMISEAAKRSHNISWQRVIEELTEKCRSQEGQMEQVEDEIDDDNNDDNNDDDDDDDNDDNDDEVEDNYKDDDNNNYKGSSANTTKYHIETMTMTTS